MALRAGHYTGLAYNNAFAKRRRVNSSICVIARAFEVNRLDSSAARALLWVATQKYTCNCVLFCTIWFPLLFQSSCIAQHPIWADPPARDTVSAHTASPLWQPECIVFNGQNCNSMEYIFWHV